MPVVSYDQLSKDMRSHERVLVNAVGLVPQAQDRPLDGNDLLFYLTETSMPMSAFLRKNGLFLGEDGLHFDLAQFAPIREVATKVIAERQAGNRDGVWKQFDLSTDEDTDYDGGYILTALAALELMYGPNT